MDALSSGSQKKGLSARPASVRSRGEREEKYAGVSMFRDDKKERIDRDV